MMAKIVAVSESELAAVRQRREALERELDKELEIENEQKKVVELEMKIKAEQHKIHPSKLGKLQEAVAELGKAVASAKAKKLQGVI